MELHVLQTHNDDFHAEFTSQFGSVTVNVSADDSPELMGAWRTFQDEIANAAAKKMMDLVQGQSSIFIPDTPMGAMLPCRVCDKVTSGNRPAGDKGFTYCPDHYPPAHG